MITQALQVGCDNANSKPGKGLMDWLCKLTFVCSVTSIFYLEIEIYLKFNFNYFFFVKLGYE